MSLLRFYSQILSIILSHVHCWVAIDIKNNTSFSNTSYFTTFDKKSAINSNYSMLAFDFSTYSARITN
jgi:hypothetical protein